MKNKIRTTTRIKLNKVERNNKNIFLVFWVLRKETTQAKVKQKKAKYEYTEN